MVVKIQVMVFWVVTPYGDVVGCFRWPCCLHLQRGSMVLRNVVLPHHHMVSQPWRPWPKFQEGI